MREYIIEWMKERKNKTKWKRPEKLDVSNFGRKYFWSYIFYLIIFLILLIKFWGKLRPLWRLVPKLLKMMKKVKYN